MANAAITPRMRVHGWNVHLLAGPDAFYFGGLFQEPNSDLITFSDVIDELRLCFNIPRTKPDKDPWDTLAFVLADPLPDTRINLPSLVEGEDLSLPVPGLPPLSSSKQSVVKYHIVSHTPCDIPFDKPLKEHLKHQCAEHICRPTRKYDPRYLPPNKASSDPRYARLPFRRTAKPRTSSQSPKRGSGSTSPTKEHELEDITELHMPPKMEIDADTARQTIESFRKNCLIDSDRCAVSGKGRSWYTTPAIGPALQACHIVPQQHYHLYPDALFQLRADEGDDVEFSPERLRQAWTNTWSSENGILLKNDLHELFDTRLVSIHPQTKKIRAFVPYDIVTEFHGRKAMLSNDVDEAALRHHYEMSCIENMAARMPWLIPEHRDMSSRTTPGVKTPLSGTVNLPISMNPDTQRGDPTKRARSEKDKVTPRDTQRDGLQEPLSPKVNIERDAKRRRVGDGNQSPKVIFQDSSSPHYDLGDFLADVSWELHKLKAVQTAT